MQLNLELTGLPDQILRVWESLDDEQRQAIVDRLRRLITRAVLDDRKDTNHDD